MRCRAWLLPILLLLAAIGRLEAQKPPIGYDAYDGWRSIQGATLTRDGKWTAYALVPQDGDGELVVKRLPDGEERRFPRGRGPEFTADGRHVVFTVAPAKEEVDKARKERRPPADAPKNGLGIHDLASNKTTTVERVISFRLAPEAPNEGPSVLVYRLEAPPRAAQRPEAQAGTSGSPKSADQRRPAQRPTGTAAQGAQPAAGAAARTPGTTLRVRLLSDGTEAEIAEVSDYRLSRNGRWLLYAVVSSDPEKDGVFARRIADGHTVALATGKGRYRQIAMSEDGSRAAFLSDKESASSAKPVFALYVWHEKESTARVLVAAGARGLPEGMILSDNGSLAFSKDGNRLTFGVAPVPVERPKDAPDPLAVDIWSWRDGLIQPMQRVRADQDARRTYLCVAHLRDGRVVALGAPDLPTVSVPEKGEYALGSTSLPYEPLVSWDDTYSDVYLVNQRTGARTRILEKAADLPQFSPEARYVVYFDRESGHWYCRRVRDGKVVNLTERAKRPFVSETWDYPAQPSSYGMAGWTEEDKAVWLYDRYDIWEANPDSGELRCLTQGVGRDRKIVFRYVRLDPEQRSIPRSAPALLSMVNEQTGATGFASLEPGERAGPRILTVADELMTVVTKARSADVLLITRQRFDTFPDLWVTDTAFSNPRRISEANPQLAEYRWGKAELMDYVSADGQPTKAVLIKPDDYDRYKQYPLMVVIYERMTANLHRFRSPAPSGGGINPSRYVSHGYLVLLPDIVYQPGYPGESAMKCVLPAIQKLIDARMVDPKRVGIEGHSWGAYEVNYLLTRTSLFAAAEAGAAVSNMISAYGGIRWQTGMLRQFQYERGQSRIGAPPWKMPLQYIENSPIFWVEKVTTPYLSMHNDNDGAVPWYQGIEFFAALRRLGKEAYLFNFNGEGHGIANRAAQKYWTVHLDEFFDHFLLGKPRPAWMEKGVPYNQRGQRDVESLFRPARQ